MQTLPSNATRYFRSRTLAGLPLGMRRQHALREGVWIRLRVLDGALALVDDVQNERVTCERGSSTDIPPRVRHHAELSGPDVRFTVELYRLPRGASRGDDEGRWENEGGPAVEQNNVDPARANKPGV
jgi:tellurite resistance-related uncharacterized protein